MGNQQGFMKAKIEKTVNNFYVRQLNSLFNRYSSLYIQINIKKLGDTYEKQYTFSFIMFIPFRNRNFSLWYE